MTDVSRAGRSLTTFNLVASALLILFGIFCLAYLIPNHVPASAVHDQGLSARFMPTVAASALTLLAFILCSNVVIRHIRGLDPILEDNEDNDIQGFGQQEIRNTVALIIGVSVYVGLLSTLGFVIASAIGLAVCLFLGGNRNWLLIGAISVGLPLMLAQALWWLLTIQVPTLTLLE